MDSETRALRRTAVLLLLISFARWLAVTTGGSPLASQSASLDELIDSSRIVSADQSARSRPLRPGERLDPNKASEVELDRLPGVGARTAGEIVADRRARGPFSSADDLTRVAGIGPSTLTRIKPHLDVPAVRQTSRGARRALASSSARRIDLNRADSIALIGLPGIGPALASRILAERRKQPFRSVDDLVRVRGVGAATVERLRSTATIVRDP